MTDQLENREIQEEKLLSILPEKLKKAVIALIAVLAVNVGAVAPTNAAERLDMSAVIEKARQEKEEARQAKLEFQASAEQHQKEIEEAQQQRIKNKAKLVNFLRNNKGLNDQEIREFIAERFPTMANL